MRFTSLLCSAMLFTGCSTAQSDTANDSPSADTQAAARPAAPRTPSVIQPQGQWIDWPLTKGDWVYRTDARGSIALYGPPNKDAVVILRCVKTERKLYFSRAGSLSGSGRMTLRASSGTQGYDAGNSGGSPPYVAIAMNPQDIMFDRIIYSRGRFAVETQSLQSIAVPIWPEFTRVVEDCRA